MSSRQDPGLVAVTGGGGFIGSHLVEVLAGCGHRVRSLQGPPGVALPPSPAPVEAFHGEITDVASLERLLAGARVVIHLAGPSSVAGSFRDAGPYRNAHIEGTARLCEVAAAVGVRRIVAVSSAEVYGRPDRNPVDEAAPMGPRSPYGAAKVAAEAIVSCSVRSGALDEAVVVRPFSVYGPGMASWSLVGSLVARADAGSTLSVQDPSVVRDLVHVADLAELLAAASTTPLREAVTTVNACSGTGRSAAELRDIVAALAGVDVDHGPVAADRPPSADITELVGDPSAARALFGWSASTSMVEGLSSMVRRRLVPNNGT